jgi:AmmeMemoRadiSam system protein B
MSAVRRPAVAGVFYPAEADELRSEVSWLVAAASGGTTPRRPKLLIVPHAGYIYSGSVAARAYALLARWRDRIERVVLLGPAHRVAPRALAAPQAAAFDTPLGRVAIDADALQALEELTQVEHDDLPHAAEHSLEVQLPFLQAVLGARFRLVPLVVGDAAAHEVAQVLERLWGGDETLIVVSSDLSHYLRYEQARAIDAATVARIVALDAALQPHEACGAFAINGALLAARAHRLAPRLLDLRNSGDTAGDRRRVVGYASLAFEQGAA